MLSLKKFVPLISTAVLLFAVTMGTEAQPTVHTLQVNLGVCKGQIKVLSQEQTAAGLDLEVEVAIEDCKGSCQGSIEYLLLFTDAEGKDVQWQMNETWKWRSLDGPFTLQLHHDTLPGSTLKEIKNMKIGRCSCSS